MLARLLLFARSLVRRSKAEREIDDEMRFHLESSAAMLEARGMAPEEARRVALLNFGNLTLTKEESRAEHRVRLLDDLGADLRYAGRALRRNPVFAAVAVLTIALGVGANTAIFGIIDTVLLRSLPVRSPESLVFLSVSGDRGRFGAPPLPWVG